MLIFEENVNFLSLMQASFLSLMQASFLSLMQASTLNIGYCTSDCDIKNLKLKKIKKFLDPVNSSIEKQNKLKKTESILGGPNNDVTSF